MFLEILVGRVEGREEMREGLTTGTVDVLGLCAWFYDSFFAVLEPEVSVDTTRTLEEVLAEVMKIIEDFRD